MNKVFMNVLFAVLTVLSCSSGSAMQVVACEQHWVQLAAVLGGDRVDARSLFAADQDPHHVSPSARALVLTRAADLFICNDIQDEAGLRALIASSDNPRIQAGRPGYIDASAYLPTDATSTTDATLARRHLHGDPHNILLVATVLSNRLAQLDPANAPEYRARLDAFSASWKHAIREWEAKATPLRNISVIEQRRSCAYLCRWLGIREVARLESERGSSVGVENMRTALDALTYGPVKMIVQGPHHSSAAVTWLEREKKLPVAIVRITAGEKPGIPGLYSMFDDAISRMLSAARHG
jgi:zinc/manganese transport system substrate-binding protein